jgi:outer membrane protein OmpA-like peptidoglycan-associated protein
MFDVNQSTLRPASQQNLQKLARILNKYEDTNILLEGHTDATGSDEYNQELSRKRAKSVSDFLTSNNVDQSRFTIMGYGESQPVADNETATGRQSNRRVEVAIFANEKLKKVAREQAG